MLNQCDFFLKKLDILEYPRNFAVHSEQPLYSLIFISMIYSTEVKNMCSVCKGAYHGPAPIPEEGKWIQAKEIKDISGYLGARQHLYQG